MWWTKRYSIILVLLLRLLSEATGQELFIHSEPASTSAKGLLSVRYSMETYEEEFVRRHWHALRIYYGLTSNLTVIGSVSISNHHPLKFPRNPFVYFNNHHLRGYNADYPLKFDGINFYARYRVFSQDEPNGHLRLAIFGEGSYVNSAHDEAEPHLLGDNSGVGGGVIATKLIRKLAFNIKAGYIHPTPYYQTDNKLSYRSGDATYAYFSAGYLLYPKKYQDYSDLNINIYMELLYKQYEAATIYLDEKYQHIQYYPFLRAGQYVEMRPGLQFIMNSRNRLDVSAGIELYGSTFLKYNPTLYLNYQKYLFK